MISTPDSISTFLLRLTKYEKNYRITSLLLPITFFIAVLSLSTFGQIAKDITRIRGEVAAINKASAKYKKVTESVDGISLEGTEATYYRSAGKLKKIALQIYGETYKATGELYYTNETLVFAFIKESRYDTQIGLETPPKVVSSEERRFYFVDGEIVRLLVGTKEVKPADDRYSELKDAVIDISGKIKP